MEYTWKITGMKVANQGDLQDAVVQTYWSKTGTDELGNVGIFSGATPFTIDPTNTANFIPFDQLTEEIVLGWIKGVVVGSYEEHVNTQIQKQIDQAKNALVDKPLPWASPAPQPQAT